MVNKEADAKMETPKVTTGPEVKFDDMGITNSQANVCNASSSLEEVVLVFGINNAWEPDASEVRVQLDSRVILNPFSAKRLSLLLDNAIKQHEARFGAMDRGPSKCLTRNSRPNNDLPPSISDSAREIIAVCKGPTGKRTLRCARWCRGVA